MQNKQETLCLFFPEPFDAAGVDEGNILASKVRRVQLFLNVAYNSQAQLHWLAALQIRVIFRLDEPSKDNAAQVAASYYSDAGRAEIVRKLRVLKGIPGLEIEAVIIGNEPEIEYDLTRGSGNWGDKPEPNFPQGRVWEHQYSLGEIRPQIQALGIKAIAPGFSHRRIRPAQKPQPGKVMWGRICTTEYDKCDLGGSHLYANSWASVEDDNRYLWAAGEECERIHTGVSIDESGVDSAPSELERMRAIMRQYELLASDPEGGWGDVVASFCAFVSNGRTGQTWSHMIMREPQCYVELGQWITASPPVLRL
jgi:hypothetical protein